jgi:hypothetical protein
MRAQRGAAPDRPRNRLKKALERGTAAKTRRREAVCV